MSDTAPSMTGGTTWSRPHRVFIAIFAGFLIACGVGLSAVLAGGSGFGWSSPQPLAPKIIAVRNGNYVEVYIAGGGGDIFDVFAVDPASFSKANGVFDFDAVQQHTSGAADTFAAKATLTTAGNGVAAEGISFAAHPPDRVMPFDDPYEALGVIAFCSVAVKNQQIATRDIAAYLGIIANVGVGDGPVTLTMQGSVSASLSAEVIEYENGQMTVRHPITLSPGGETHLTFFDNRLGGLAS